MMRKKIVFFSVLLLAFAMIGCRTEEPSTAMEDIVEESTTEESAVEEVCTADEGEEVNEEINAVDENEETTDEVEEIDEGAGSEIAQEPRIIPNQPSFLWIDKGSDSLINEFSTLYEFDYFLVHGFQFEGSIVMWAEIPMRDFSIITVNHEFTDENMYAFVEESWLVAHEVLVGEGIVINGYHGSGTLPTSGFAFTDENGQTRYFTFIENMGYPTDPGPYRWIILEFDNTAGHFVARMFS